MFYNSNVLALGEMVLPHGRQPTPYPCPLVYKVSTDNIIAIFVVVVPSSLSTQLDVFCLV